MRSPSFVSTHTLARLPVGAIAIIPPRGDIAEATAFRPQCLIDVIPGDVATRDAPEHNATTSTGPLQVATFIEASAC